MNLKEFANMLDGRPYGHEITEAEEALAKKLGFVVVFGYSDDNAELRGAINDEIGCFDGGVLEHEDLPDTIYANWCPEDIDCSWAYGTSIPHEKFCIYDDGELYCVGIVCDINKPESANNNKIKVMLDPGAIMPTRAHSTDAGLDLYSPFEFILKQSTGRDIVTLDGIPVKAGFRTVDTGVHVEIPAGYVGMIKSKSGLNVNHGILSEGVIDAGYTGSIRVKLYNLGESDLYIGRGQKISQLVILPIITPELELVDGLEDTERGTGGFGSTGIF